MSHIPTCISISCYIYSICIYIYIIMTVVMDEAENRIQKILGIEFKEELNSNLIPTCLFFI